MKSPGFALAEAMRARLLADGALTALLGGGYVFDEVPRGVPPTYVEFTFLETRDWSTAEMMAHEHFVGLAVRSNSRSRKLAEEVSGAVQAAFESAPLVLDGHRLVNLRLVFWNVAKAGTLFGASLRYRAATEPN